MIISVLEGGMKCYWNFKYLYPEDLEKASVGVLISHRF